MLVGISSGLDFFLSILFQGPIMDKRELVYLYNSLFNVLKITFKSINEELSALTFSNNRGL